MMGLSRAGVWSCRWQDRTLIHAVSWLKRAHTGYLQINRYTEFIAPFDRETSPEVLFMDPSALTLFISSWPSCLSLHQTLYSCTATLDVWSMIFKGLILRPSCTPYFGTCLASACFKSPSSCLSIWIMVRHRLRSRYGGCRGGRGRSQPAPSPEIPMAPAYPPSAFVIPLRISSPGKHFPHNTFQTTHFKFQSSLNKPILSANITIIFAEEEARPSGSVHTLETQSQSGHGSKQHGEDAGNVFNCGDVHAEGSVPDVSKPPNGDLQGVSGSVDLAECSYGISGSVAFPGGSGMVSEETKGDFWEGNACPAAEEDWDHVTNV